MIDDPPTCDGVRRIALMTMIEVAILEGTYKTWGPAMGAHALLTGKTMAETREEFDQAFAINKLRELYPQLVRPSTESEAEWAKLSAGKAPPVAIWHRGDARAYYDATEDERSAWNFYAQTRANEVSNSLDFGQTLVGMVGWDRDGNVTNWCPELFFPEWLAKRRAIMGRHK